MGKRLACGLKSTRGTETTQHSWLLRSRPTDTIPIFFWGSHVVQNLNLHGNSRKSTNPSAYRLFAVHNPRSDASRFSPLWTVIQPTHWAVRNSWSAQLLLSSTSRFPDSVAEAYELRGVQYSSSVISQRCGIQISHATWAVQRSGRNFSSSAHRYRVPQTLWISP